MRLIITLTIGLTQSNIQNRDNLNAIVSKSAALDLDDLRLTPISGHT